jgi:hypothetical protein
MRVGDANILAVGKFVAGSALLASALLSPSTDWICTWLGAVSPFTAITLAIVLATTSFGNAWIKAKRHPSLLPFCGSIWLISC